MYWIDISTRHFILELIFLGIVGASALIDGSRGDPAAFDRINQAQTRVIPCIKCATEERKKNVEAIVYGVTLVGGKIICLWIG